MASYNKVLLMGNLTRDPEVRYTPKGTAIATIGLAVNRRWTTDAGEQKEEVTFVVAHCGAESLPPMSCRKGSAWGIWAAST